MLRDYRPNQKIQAARAVQQQKFKINRKILFSILLTLIMVGLVAMAIKSKLTDFYQLKTNERLLLIENQKPVGILFFNVDDQQLVITDLRESNFDLSSLDKEATLSSSVKKNLVYAFLFQTAFDQSYQYPYDDLSREKLLAFFKNQKNYYFFLKNQELLWREQTLVQVNVDQEQPIFNCAVALINTTTETGLANSLATILENSAFSIIKKGSNTDNLAQTKIIYNQNEPACEEVLKKLQRILPESLVVADQQAALQQRAALVIYIGRDLADLYVFFINLFHGQV
jgi:hypothetical protein